MTIGLSKPHISNPREIRRALLARPAKCCSFLCPHFLCLNKPYYCEQYSLFMKNFSWATWFTLIYYMSMKTTFENEIFLVPSDVLYRIIQFNFLIQIWLSLLNTTEVDWSMWRSWHAYESCIPTRNFLKLNVINNIIGTWHCDVLELLSFNILEICVSAKNELKYNRIWIKKLYIRIFSIFRSILMMKSL